MLRELLYLWLTQQRRQFRWARVLTMAYFLLWMLVMVVAVIAAAGDELRAMVAKVNTWAFVPVTVSSLVIADVLMKLIFNDSAPIMDDCLRTKPVTVRAWSQFTAVTTLLDYWNWMIPLLVGVTCLVLLPVGVALTAIVLAALQSQMLSWLITDIHKAPGNQYTLPLWAGLIAYQIVTAVAGGAAAAAEIYAMENGGGLPWATPAAILFMAGLNVLMLSLLYRYFGHMHAYDEHQAHVEHARRIGDITLFSTEYLGVWRSKRFRTPLTIVTLLFIFQAYQQQGATIQEDLGGLNIGLYFALCWPSLFLGQWVFGIEANFFHGLWTKPFSVEKLLQRKFYFMVMLTAAMALLMVPAVIWMGLSLTRLLALLLFVGFAQTLLLMPTCLLATRVDLFSSAFFNYQGANKGVNLYGLLVFIPIVLYAAATLLLDTWLTDTLLAAIGLIGAALHRPVLRRLARQWVANRHGHMERYMK